MHACKSAIHTAVCISSQYYVYLFLLIYQGNRHGKIKAVDNF